MRSTQQYGVHFETLVGELFATVASASLLTKQCEIKLSEFKRRVQDPFEAASTLEAEILALMTATACLYREARGRAHRAQVVIDELSTNASLQHLAGEATMLLSQCGHAGRAVTEYERSLAQLEVQANNDLATFRDACSDRQAASRASATFQQLMNRTMGAGRYDRQ